ncbi:hypothetical protein F5J12DRAFT_826126 [Pisolithus orientalis]|uniref:uncharacterized protein n=1 Tax=Pisolithus orientalis TaxID=936130 RepID=UPI0022243D4E|nr:uncharacterized protein F5J12DRAFT_826126 [Pisolithus orientalis]KAI6008833.1 hypothetical protein F5J12DRAFT_826126 [Pisolithus orientalis]
MQVGEITFFKRLPSMMKTELRSEVSIGNMQDQPVTLTPQSTLSFTSWTMTRNAFKGRRQSEAGQDPRLEAVLPLLHKRCQVFDVPGGAFPPNEKQKVECEVKSISQVLSVSLLRHINFAFSGAYVADEDSLPAKRPDYDRLTNTCTVVEEIRVLQMKLSATEDDDEQRALEEDITGKILWLFWCGICTEAEQLLPEVASYIRREGNMKGLRMLQFLIIARKEYVELDDDQANMQRIMLDAGAGTSKHQLLLAARAAEQIKWPDSQIPSPSVL